MSPINADDFNYTPFAVVVVIGFAGIWYAVSARKWFKGPKIQGTPEELAAIEHELSDLASSESPRSTRGGGRSRGLVA